ncbi:MAG: SagB family peptide dehydrogenase [Xenococcaceae cyanobacterium]
MFTLSFKPETTLIREDDNLILQSPLSTSAKKPPETRTFFFPHPQPGLQAALNHLKQGTKTLTQLQQLEREKDGLEGGQEFNIYLQKLIDAGWICHSVFPLATAIPLVGEDYPFDCPEIDWQQATFTLSRFAYLHQLDGEMVLESPCSKSKIILQDWRGAALIAKLIQPQTCTSLRAEIPEITAEIAQQFLSLLLATQMLSNPEGQSKVELEEEKPPLMYWEFHDFLFHSRSRIGRHDKPTGGTMRFHGQTEPLPTVKPPMSKEVVQLFKPNLNHLATIDIPLTQALELRQSIREYDVQPMTAQQLGKLLYCCARVKRIETIDIEEFGEIELNYRPYPSGGAIYELEIYPVVNRCQGLNEGVYQYLPLEHQLCRISGYTPSVEKLIKDAFQNSGEQDIPQILLVITARFGRLFWKYQSLAYAVILKHVGVLYQTFYLVATGMNLAPCALGTGNSDLFAKITGLDYYEESSVGEFMLGSVRQQR